MNSEHIPNSKLKCAMKEHDEDAKQRSGGTCGLLWANLTRSSLSVPVN